MKPVTVILTLAFFGVLTLVFRPGLLLFLWPVVAIGSAVFFYKRHRNRIEPERRIPVGVYVFAVVVCGGIAGFLGMLLGARWACAGPHPGNQCFLLGVFVVGPISGALAIFLVGLALFLIRPRAKLTGGGAS